MATVSSHQLTGSFAGKKVLLSKGPARCRENTSFVSWKNLHIQSTQECLKKSNCQFRNHVTNLNCKVDARNAPIPRAQVLCRAGEKGSEFQTVNSCSGCNAEGTGMSAQIDKLESVRGDSQNRSSEENSAFNVHKLIAGIVFAGALMMAGPGRAYAKGKNNLPSPPATGASAVAISEKKEDKKVESVKQTKAKAGLTEEDVATMLAEEKEADLIPLLKLYLEENPEDVSAIKALLKFHMQEGELEEGLKVLERLIEKEPDQMEWQLVKAQAKEFMGDLEQARKGYNRVLKKEPFSAKALQGLATVMQKSGEDSLVLGMLEEAIQKASQADKHKEDVTNLKLLLGQMHTLQGNVAEALQQYDELIKEDPNDFRPYLCQGLVYSLVGNKEQADESFKQFQRRCPQDYGEKARVDTLMVKAKAAARRVKDSKKREEMAKAKNKRPKGGMVQPKFTPDTPDE